MARIKDAKYAKKNKEQHNEIIDPIRISSRSLRLCGENKNKKAGHARLF
jgi:hypothetical protein